jgi:hypothetical protein
MDDCTAAGTCGYPEEMYWSAEKEARLNRAYMEHHFGASYIAPRLASEDEKKRNNRIYAAYESLRARMASDSGDAFSICLGHDEFGNAHLCVLGRTEESARKFRDGFLDENPDLTCNDVHAAQDFGLCHDV